MSRFWTSLPSSGGGNLSARRLLQGTFTVLCLFALSSCGGDGPSSSAQTSASAATNTAAPGTPAEQTSVAPPPGADNRPLLPGQSGAPQLPDGMPALQPARGVNLETLFAQDIKDPVDRVKRVENAVVELRRDFDSVLPAIVRLSAVEQDMQELLTQLDSLLRSEPPAANTAYPASAPAASSMDAASAPASLTPPAQAPPVADIPATPQAALAQSVPETPAPAAVSAPAPAPAPAAAAAPVAAPGATSVTALRVGEHPGKTRMVFDMTGASTYRYDLDNAENLLVLEISGAGWSAPATQTFAKSPILQSYSTQPMDGGGTRVILLLKRAASVVYEAALKPEGTNGHRLVIDLK